MYKKKLTVNKEDVDLNGHVNNVRYVQWMQDVAVEHSRHVGCDQDVYQALGATWVARSHHIDYVQPAFEHDSLEIETWIDRFRKVSCFRKYEFKRATDKTIVARAETEWVYIHATSGRPRKIDPAIIERFS